MGDAPGPAPSQAPAAAAPKTSGKYVPPSLRDGVNKGRGETMSSKRGLYFFFTGIKIYIFLTNRIYFFFNEKFIVLH